MDHQIEFFYKFRFVFAGLFAGICLLLLSILVTIVGSNSVINPKTTASANALAAVNMSDTSTTVTAGTYNLLNSARRTALSTGVAFYSVCRSITNATGKTGTVTAHSSAATVHGVGTGMAFVGRGFGDGVLFTFHGIGATTAFTGRMIGDGVGATAN